MTVTGGRPPGPAAGPGGPPASASSESAGHTHPPAVTTESRSSCQCAIRRRRSRRLIPSCRPGLSVAHPCQYRRPGLSILTRTRSARPLGRAHSVPGRTHSPPRRSGFQPRPSMKFKSQMRPSAGLLSICARREHLQVRLVANLNLKVTVTVSLSIIGEPRRGVTTHDGPEDSDHRVVT